MPRYIRESSLWERPHCRGHTDRKSYGNSVVVKWLRVVMNDGVFLKSEHFFPRMHVLWEQQKQNISLKLWYTSSPIQHMSVFYMGTHQTYFWRWSAGGMSRRTVKCTSEIWPPCCDLSAWFTLLFLSNLGPLIKHDLLYVLWHQADTLD